MSLHGAVDDLTEGERARHPESLAVAAYFDSWDQASGGPARSFPRPFTPDEKRSWRDGWLEARAERAVYGDSRSVMAAGTPLAPPCHRCPIAQAVAA